MLKYLLRIIKKQTKEIYILNECLHVTRKLLEEEKDKNEQLLAIIKKT